MLFENDSQLKNQERANAMANDEPNITKKLVIIFTSNCGLHSLSSWKDQALIRASERTEEARTNHRPGGEEARAAHSHRNAGIEDAESSIYVISCYQYRYG